MLQLAGIEYCLAKWSGWARCAHSYEMPAGQAQVEAIVDIVQQPAGGRLDAFPGLYVNALPEQPFLDDTTVLLTTQWRSSSDIVAIDLDSKQVQRLRPEGSRGSWSLLAIGNGV